MCITNKQPDTKYNPNPNPTTKQHAVVGIQLNTVTCATYQENFIQDNFVAPFSLLSVVIVTQPMASVLHSNSGVPASDTISTVVTLNRVQPYVEQKINKRIIKIGLKI